MVQDTALVLEGGGMRGIYTGGVLDFFMEKNIRFPYTIGVSAGACNGSSLISNQPGRNKQVNIGFIHDPRYLSFRNFITKREMFGMDFLFDEIPNIHVPFDFETFFASSEEFVIGTTDVHSGKSVYFGKNDYTKESILPIIRASSSLPLMAPIVKVDGFELLDGGIVDPIPTNKARIDGYEKQVLILTRESHYRKKPSKFSSLLKTSYRKYPALVKAIQQRYKLYNDTMDEIEERERAGELFVIRPTRTMEVKRIDRNEKRLESLYEQGYNDAKEKYKELLDFVNMKPVLNR
ncbi:patatin-like phospholipase family protein [Mangrovibacillus cuniculi]|uniref:Patatin family protein n=1 Tax=Mangrovibacillus cuniculi TaxID=2593652 RepID=A0A7S8CAU6_9BACI|nr:patatin family protein [Mangrovibacillus cuniculi]QPC46591.1 patatin family protein [Mangrovibacillus cuniculi]